MILEFAPRAVREAERYTVWWREHRPAARGLFEEELAAALNRIRTAPQLGMVYGVIRELEYRRVLLPETRYHVYYRLAGTPTDERVRIVAIWGAVRGRGPRM